MKNAIIGKTGKWPQKIIKMMMKRLNQPLVKELANHTFFFVKILTKLLTLAMLRDRINSGLCERWTAQNPVHLFKEENTNGLHVNRTATDDEETFR